MEVYKRTGSASWYVDLVHPATGKRVRQSLKFTGPKVQAQKRADQLQRELETEAKQYEDGRRPTTLGAAVEAYVSSLEARGQVAAKDHRYRMERMFGRSAPRTKGHAKAPGKAPDWHTLDPAMPLHDLTPAAMETLSLARSREGKKPQTIKHELGLIRAATRYAASLGYRTPALMTKGEIDNPWRVPEVAQKTRYLSPEEFQKVYDYLDPERPVWGLHGAVGYYPLPAHLKAARQESQDLLVALAYTGGRWTEVALLTWDRVDFKAGTIRLWAGKVEKERLVPMADPLRAVLGRRYAPFVGIQATSLVFPGPGGRPRTKPSDALGAAMTTIGLNRPDVVAKYGKATCHSLRHTFASWLIQNGADLSEVRDALGHSTVTTTTRYAHLAKGATMAKLGGILSKIGGKDGGIGTAEAATGALAEGSATR